MNTIGYAVERQIVDVSLAGGGLEINSCWTDFKIGRKVYMSKEMACDAVYVEAVDTVEAYDLIMSQPTHIMFNKESIKRDNGVAFTLRGEDGDQYTVVIKIVTCSIIGEET